MKLYELASEYEAFLSAIESGDIPEEAIADTLESIESEIEVKADNVACLLKGIDAEVEAIKAEETRLAERRKAKEKRRERIKEYLATTLIAMGKTEVETARNRISFRKSEKTLIEDKNAFIEWASRNNDSLLTYSKPTISLTAVKEAIIGGAELPGASIEICQNIQIN